MELINNGLDELVITRMDLYFNLSNGVKCDFQGDSVDNYSLLSEQCG